MLNVFNMIRVTLTCKNVVYNLEIILNIMFIRINVKQNVTAREIYSWVL